MKQNPLCIYHGNCADGFAAALAVRLHYGADNVDFHKGNYGDPPPDVKGRSVIMVDFSYKRDVLLEMANGAMAIIILDHHKSARDELVDLPTNVLAYFDMDRSGAVMAWEHYFGPEDNPLPDLYLHIQDRDLWRFELPLTREICAAVFSYPYDFDVWYALLHATNELAKQGAAINRKHQKDVAELIDYCVRGMVIGGYTVPVCNVPYIYASDIGHELCKTSGTFAATYTDTADGRKFSLRSVGEFDVSKVAQQFGGGGHKNAAGFTVPIGWEGESRQAATICLTGAETQSGLNRQRNAEGLIEQLPEDHDGRNTWLLNYGVRPASADKRSAWCGVGLAWDDLTESAETVK